MKTLLMKFCVINYNKILWKYIACFVLFFTQDLKNAYWNQTIKKQFICVFSISFGDMIFEWNIQFSPVRFNGLLIWMLYKYNIYRPLNYTLRMMINNNIFFRHDPILYILAWFKVVRLHPHCHSSVFFCFMLCNKKWEVGKFPNFPTNVILRQIK